MSEREDGPGPAGIGTAKIDPDGKIGVHGGPRRKPPKKPSPPKPQAQQPVAAAPIPDLPYAADHMGAGMRVQLTYAPGITRPGIFQAPRFLFQCPPMAPFTVVRGHDSQEYETAYTGTYSVAAAPKLDVIQFKTLMVEDPYGWALTNGFDIENARRLLETLSRAGDPFHLLCVHHYGIHPEYTGLVTLTDYTHTEDEPYTYYADVSFKEYQVPAVDTRVPGAAPKPKRPGGKHWPKHHKLVQGQSLYDLAVTFYGRPSLAKLIAKANGVAGTNYREPLTDTPGFAAGRPITIPMPPPPGRHAYRPGGWNYFTNLPVNS